MFENRLSLESIVKGRHYVIATDGSCIGNPGVGGWSFIKQLKDGDRLLRQSPMAGRCGCAITTNVRMEMTAAIKALESMREKETPLVISSDSQILVKGMTEWLSGWKEKGWSRAKGALVNVDLWQLLDVLSQGKHIVWEWVKGHADNQLINQADMLAKEAAKGRYPNGKKSLRKQCPFLFIDENKGVK